MRTGRSEFEAAIDALLAQAAEWSDFAPESVARPAVRRVLENELAAGGTIAEVLRRAAAREPRLVRALKQAIGTRETYFFRNPGQFELVAAGVPALAVRGALRVWSAGCATGEETWPLAATVAAVLPPGRLDSSRVCVLGTDVHEPALDLARAGIYQLSAQRSSGPLLFPVVTAEGDRLRVRAPLRGMTSFEAHDLRDPPPGEFEVIFCRNVLIYFQRAVARLIVQSLVSALTTDGLLVFGTMDVDSAELRHLTRIGPPECMAFSKRAAPPARGQPPTSPRSAAVPGRQPPPASNPPLELHQSALTRLERGDRSGADKILAQLVLQHPDYLPGRLERALSLARLGNSAAAIAQMRQVLACADGRDEAEVVRGLEDLPVRFYREAARAFLQRTEKQ